MSEKIIAIRIRGNVGIRKPISDALDYLNLRNQHNAVILDAKPSVIGALKKVQGYITYGVADAESIKLIQAKMKEGDKCAKLAPPRKGYERKGTKVPFVNGGALGDRKEAIGELVKRMV